MTSIVLSLAIIVTRAEFPDSEYYEAQTAPPNRDGAVRELETMSC
jgi:hypothetical protein